MLYSTMSESNNQLDHVAEVQLVHVGDVQMLPIRGSCRRALGTAVGRYQLMKIQNEDAGGNHAIATMAN